MTLQQAILATEVVSTVLGLLAVALLTVGNGRGWFVGVVSILMTSVVYVAHSIYGSALLQVYFLLTQLWGWWSWRKGEEQDLRLVSRTLSVRRRLLSVILVAMATVAAAHILQSVGGQSVWWDGFVTSGSVVAQTLMVLNYGECWLWWVVVDVVYVGLSWRSELWSYTLLYLVYCGLALNGWREWTRDGKA